jgi:diacylglycerol O-acyltransferase / wax synthase
LVNCICIEKVICGHIASAPMDRRKPLWEMWVIEGVADTDPRAGGLLAGMTKVHNAAVDGVSGANLLSQLCSAEPDTAPPEPVDARPAVPRLRAEHHGDVAARQVECGRHFLPGPPARPVAIG